MSLPANQACCSVLGRSTVLGEDPVPHAGPAVQRDELPGQSAKHGGGVGVMTAY